GFAHIDAARGSQGGARHRHVVRRTCRIAGRVLSAVAAFVRATVAGGRREGLALRDADRIQRVVGLRRAVAALPAVLEPLAFAERLVDDGGERNAVRRIHDRIERIGNGTVVAAVRGVKGQALHPTARADDVLAVDIPLHCALVEIGAGRIGGVDYATVVTAVIHAYDIGIDWIKSV